MAGWPSPAERRALDAFPAQIGPEDLDEHFKVSPADMRFALKHRGDSRLGVAVQLCALRWLGFIPDDLMATRSPRSCRSATSSRPTLRTSTVTARAVQTRSDQLAAARAHAGFRPWDAPEAAALEAWLTIRAMEHERPKALFTLAAEKLHVQRIARPSVDQRPADRRCARARASGDVRRARRPAHRPRHTRPLRPAARAAHRRHDVNRVAAHARAGRVAQVHPPAAGEVHLPPRPRRRADRPVRRRGAERRASRRFRR